MSFQVFFQSFGAAVLAEAGGLEAAEGGRGVVVGVGVGPDGAGLQPVGDGVGLACVVGPDSGGESVPAGVGPREEFLDRGEGLDDEAARLAVARHLGHNRVRVTVQSYVEAQTQRG